MSLFLPLTVSHPRTDDHVLVTMQKILAETPSGAFVTEWMDENATGRKKFLGGALAGYPRSHRTNRENFGR
jgi:hypothetical protein